MKKRYSFSVFFVGLFFLTLLPLAAHEGHETPAVSVPFSTRVSSYEFMALDELKTVEEARRFVAKMERNRYGLFFLNNNRSQRPVYVIYEKDQQRWRARHPMNEVYWKEQNNEWTFAGIASWESLVTLPAMRTLVSYKGLSGFSQHGPFRASYRGNEKKGFDVRLFTEDGKVVKHLRMEKGRIKETEAEAR